MLLGKLEDKHQLTGCLKISSRFSKVQGVINYQKTFNNECILSILLVMHAPRKIKDGIRFSFDILFIFDFDVCVGTEENLMLKQEVKSIH